MFPVRVAVETVRPEHCISCAHEGHRLLDTYAVVSGSTNLSQLVETVLSALGHPQLAMNSRGLVQINNWKALPFEAITDNPEESVESLFKDIAGHITLRILAKHTGPDHTQCITEVKNRLLKMAYNRQPTLLSTVDNQQIKDLISQLITGDDSSTLLDHEQIGAISEWLDQMDAQEDRKSPLSSTPEKFSSLFEVPKLEKWFKNDPNPSRQKLLNYVNILNGFPYRRSNGKINYSQICTWFASERTKVKPSARDTLNSILSSGSVPLSLLPDFRGKFDLPTPTCEKDEIRVDSESPGPTDDHSAHSSDNGNVDEYGLKQESTASSPDLSMGMPLSVASSSPKHPGLLGIPSDLSSLSALGGLGNLGGLSSVLAAQAAIQQHHQQQQLLAAQQSQHSLSNLPSSGCNTPAPQHQVARSRLMFDPLTELPVLEKWFEENPHPTWMQIDQYTQTLNSCPYRENYPPISQHNVKIWFKNRRAKCKRMQTGISDQKSLVEKLFAQVQ
ncbi:unnamed protein product, partial [Mesorhabditis belari]|uniref:Uncharacterized protein n=1 Tax=Mesorhabditis belari TaxID=2138241 RepID=A0AAF3FM10_9BILA